jgi:hypothetical protein
VAIGGPRGAGSPRVGEGPLERAQKEVLERKRLSASALMGADDQPSVLTLAEKYVGFTLGIGHS